MSGLEGIQAGMPVYGRDDRLLGTIGNVNPTTFEVNGRDIPKSAVTRVAGDRVYVDWQGLADMPAGADVTPTTAGTATTAGAGYGAAGPYAGQLQPGMDVVGSDTDKIGTVKELRANDFLVNRTMQRDIYVPYTALSGVTGGRAMLSVPADRVDNMGWPTPEDRGDRTDWDTRAAAGTATENARYTRNDQGEVVVPVVEERLDVEKRPAELGEVTINKNVTEERREVPVDLRREEVHVERRDVPDRPVRAGEADLRDETIRVPVRGEEAVVRKEPVVTDEVVIDKTQTTERQTAADTVRKERVDVDKDLDETRRGRMGREDIGTPATARAGAAVPPPPATAPERAGATTAGRQPQMGMDVLGSDDAMIGRVKEVRATDFLVDRRMQRDIYVPNDAIRDVARGQVNLNIPAHQVDNMGWANPPLM
ncbi:MAG TPA: DUF2382 domain-containing protein [Thermomicrobiales bacterium]|nr:DUF2382 domain-containing protein [Thermomicrobiales bacterium]